MSLTTLEHSPKPPPPLTPFARRLRELLAGENQGDVGRKLGFSQQHVSAHLRSQRPSRAFVDALVRVYGVDREEWYALAGFASDVTPEDERAEVGRLVLLGHSGAQIFLMGVLKLEQLVGHPIGIAKFHVGLESLTPETARAHLRDLAAELGLPEP